jgi:hypothetical protein
MRPLTDALSAKARLDKSASLDHYCQEVRALAPEQASATNGRTADVGHEPPPSVKDCFNVNRRRRFPANGPAKRP